MGAFHLLELAVRTGPSIIINGTREFRELPELVQAKLASLMGEGRSVLSVLQEVSLQFARGKKRGLSRSGGVDNKCLTKL